METLTSMFVIVATRKGPLRAHRDNCRQLRASNVVDARVMECIPSEAILCKSCLGESGSTWGRKIIPRKSDQ